MSNSTICQLISLLFQGFIGLGCTRAKAIELTANRISKMAALHYDHAYRMTEEIVALI